MLSRPLWVVAGEVGGVGRMAQGCGEGDDEGGEGGEG